MLKTNQTTSGYEIPQIISKGSDDNSCKVIDSPDCFISGDSIYAPIHKGNKIKFFTTGEDYFDAVARAISNAKHCVFIAGWQINYDIILSKDKTKSTNSYISTRDKKQQQLDDIIEEHEQYLKDVKEGRRTHGFREPYLRQRIKEKIQDIEMYDKKIAQSMQDKTLWHYLRSAVERGVNVYVMPWSCPPVGPLVTYDVEAMCAVYQLNAGLKERRAFFTFSSAKTDMGSQPDDSAFSNVLQKLGGMFFSHHQKCVVIDNEIGYLGGIDLAYGRKDDANFRLACENRIGNDRYNPCIPPIKTVYRSEFATRNTLIFSTLFEMAAPLKVYQSIWGLIDVFKRIKNWNESPYSWQIAYAFRHLKKAISDKTEDIQNYILETVFDPLLGNVATMAIDLTLMMLTVLTVETQNYLDQNENLIGIESTKTLKTLLAKAKANGKLEHTDYQQAAPAIRDWFTKTSEGQLFSTLMDQEISFITPENTSTASNLDIILGRLLAVLQTKASQMEEPYDLLYQNPKPLQPRSGKTLDPIVQPRMPWHDMQFEVQGPAVYDVSRNFIDRWNAGQMFLERASKAPDTQFNQGVDQFVTALLKFIEMLFANVDKIKHLGLKLIAMYIENAAKNKVQQLGELLKAAKPEPFFINRFPYIPVPPRELPEKGDALVQIIRSAPAKLLQYEQEGRESAKLYLDSYMNSSTYQGEIAELENAQEIANEVNRLEKVTDALNRSMIGLSEQSPLVTDTKAEKSKIQSYLEVFKEHSTPKQIVATTKKQNDCEQAWIKAIQSSQNFIYIESQYFQSDFGQPMGYRDHAVDTYTQKIGNVSGPMNNIIHFDSEVMPYIDYIGGSEAIAKTNVGHIDLNKVIQVIYGLSGKDIDPVTNQRNPNPRLLIKFKKQLSTVWMAQFSGKVTKQIFKQHENIEKPQTNGVMKAIAERIKKAIACNETFHTYIVMPVHPEGMLNDPTVMHGVHLAMQTLYSGDHSLIKQIQQAMAIKELRTNNRGISKDEALRQVTTPTIEGNDPPYATQDWSKYLTVLNLRSWETLASNRGKRNVTEQIYVHSKLLIVDDRVAIVGSANVNDRSMAGDRDSEIAAIIHGNTKKMVKLDGQFEAEVSELVHNFRVKIWRKLFALDISHDTIKPASKLSTILTQPAAPDTVTKIKERAKINLDNYTAAFPFIPQNNSPVQATQGKAQPDRGKLPKTIQGTTYYPLGCSIWPLWVYNDPDDHNRGGKLTDQMPFDEGFWNNQLTQYQAPDGIQGFITAMPVEWTKGENNLSPNAQSLLASIDSIINKALQEYYVQNEQKQQDIYKV